MKIFPSISGGVAGKPECEQIILLSYVKSQILNLASQTTLANSLLLTPRPC